MSHEKNEKSDVDSYEKDVEVTAADPTVVDEHTTDPHMHRALKGRQVSMIAIVRFYISFNFLYLTRLRLVLLELVSSSVPVKPLLMVGPLVPFSATPSSVFSSVA
jgi:hypothetical protein